MNKLRWGILGTGKIARKFAAQLGQADGQSLAAVGSRSSESAKAFCDEHGGRPHGGYHALLEDAEVDAVYVSLPNGMHAEWSTRALEAGKHVLCEKPIASHAEEAEMMFDVASRCDRLLVEAFMYRAHPAIEKLIETVRGGALGDVRLIRSHFSFCRAPSRDDARYQPDQAGGALMDVGCYPVNLCRALTGSEPSGCHAVAHMHGFGVDDYAAGTLTFPGDVLATFSCGMTVQDDKTTVVGGTEGYLVVDGPWFGPSHFEIVRGDFVRGIDRERFDVACDKPVYAVEAEAFARAVSGETRPWITRDDSLGNMRALDALRDSIGLTYR